MLNSSALMQASQAFLSQGVDNIFVCTREGLLLAAANNQREAQANAAIVSTIFGDYEMHLPADEETPPIDLDLMIVQGSQSTLAVQRVHELCFCALGKCPIGRLVETLQKIAQAAAPSIAMLPLEGED